MMEARELVSVEENSKIEEFRTGDTVRVGIKVREGERERIQDFQGVVIRNRKGDSDGSFTVRRVSFEVGVERTFLRRSPMIDSVSVVRRGKVRRARIYYIRGRSGRSARIKERR